MEDFHGLLEKHRELIRKSKDSGVPCLQQMMLEFIRFGLENPKHYEMMFIINEPELQRYSRSEQVHYLDLFCIGCRGIEIGVSSLELVYVAARIHLVQNSDRTDLRAGKAYGGGACEIFCVVILKFLCRGAGTAGLKRKAVD